MTQPTRQQRAEALETWANDVRQADLVDADMSVLRTIAALSDESHAVQRAITEAVLRARASDHSWSQIGAMLGVSKQAAQRKYSKA